MEKMFEFKTVKAADPSQPMNGNNGNYSVYDVFYNGEYITEATDCDWCTINNTWIRNGLEMYDPTYCIYDGSVYKISDSQYSDEYYDIEKFSEGEWIPLDDEEEGNKVLFAMNM